MSPTLARDAAAGFSRHPGLERKLARELSGEVRFDAFTRGRYATDASIYQIMPAGVVVPEATPTISRRCCAIAREEGVPVIARGAGTSQNGQPIGAGLVVDFSRHLNAVKSYDPEARTVTVEPGIVLERLNARLKRDGLFFPVEPSTASRCTIGGMTGNNSCGARSIFYGKMVDNVLVGRRHAARRRALLVRPASTMSAAESAARERVRSLGGAHARRSPTGSAPRSRRVSRRCSAGSAATTSTASSRRCRTSPISSSARKARSRSPPR